MLPIVGEYCNKMIINIAQKTHLKFASIVQMSQVPPDELKLLFLMLLFFLEHQLLMNFGGFEGYNKSDKKKKKKGSK